LFNSAEYLTASKTVACKQVQNFRPPRSFDFQIMYNCAVRHIIVLILFKWNFTVDDNGMTMQTKYILNKNVLIE
jgi:hypothetical protein